MDDPKITVVKMDNGMVAVYLDDNIIYEEQHESFRLDSLFQRLGYEAEVKWTETQYPVPEKLSKLDIE